MDVEKTRSFVTYQLGAMNVSSDLLVEYMYFINKRLDELNFNYSLCSTGLKSRNMRAYIHTMLEKDYICFNNKRVNITELGTLKLCKEYNKDYLKIIEGIILLLDNYSYEIIKLASIVDIVMVEQSTRYPMNSENMSKGNIMETVTRFAPKYMTEINFDKSIELINGLRDL